MPAKSIECKCSSNLTCGYCLANTKPWFYTTASGYAVAETRAWGLHMVLKSENHEDFDHGTD